MKDLEKENEELRAALRYIACPTMGVGPGEDPEEVAMTTDERNARLALQTCIGIAKHAIKDELD